MPEKMKRKEMQIEQRTFTCDLLKIETRAKDDDAPVIRGHAAVFDTLSENMGGWREQVAKGAFAEAIKEDDVRALFNHDANRILGRNRSGTLKLSEDDTGLSVEIDPPDTQYARDLITSIDRGDVSQMSFAFRIRPNGENWAEDDDGQIIRTLTKVRLYDVSPVTYPAYTDTDVALRSFELFVKAKDEGGEALAEYYARQRQRLDFIERTL